MEHACLKSKQKKHCPALKSWPKSVHVSGCSSLIGFLRFTGMMSFYKSFKVIMLDLFVHRFKMTPNGDPGVYPQSSPVGTWLAPLEQLRTKLFAQGHLDRWFSGIHFIQPHFVSFQDSTRSTTPRHPLLANTSLCLCWSVMTCTLVTNVSLNALMRWKKRLFFGYCRVLCCNNCHLFNSWGLLFIIALQNNYTTLV